MTRTFTKTLFTLLASAFLAAAPLSAAKIFGEKITKDDFKRIKADHWRLVGKNIIAGGNVHVPFGNFELSADQVVINLESRDLEAVGNIRLHHWESATVTVEPDKLDDAVRLAGVRVEVIGTTGDIWGKHKIQLKVSRSTDSITTHRITGNLGTGYFSFDRAQLHFRNFVCRVESGERKPDGVIVLRKAEMSACGYLEHDNGHYSFGANEMTLVPFAPDSYDQKEHDYGSGTGDYAIWMTNAWARLYGVPVLWLPAFYKPRDESPGICSLTFGHTGDWGYFVSMRKRFWFYDYPSMSAQLMGDYYSLRGFGYGVNGHVKTEDSRTEFIAYSIHDNHPYKESDYHKYLLKVPSDRYNFRVSNVTHITPRLDFRGAFEYTSDYYFTKDFFSSRYSSDPQPSTYAALEQQFDIFSASVYFRARVNRFYSTVEKIPEVRLDFHRQRIFNTPLYYQGDFSADYMRMRWMKFDFDPKDVFMHKQAVKRRRAIRKGEYDENAPTPRFTLKDYKLKDYESFRLDTTHFIYLPLQKFGFSLIPRAGFKLTGYSNSSKHPVSANDLIQLINAADPTSKGVGNLNNYDHRGGSRVRVVGELGAEASFKIHNTWQNARSDFLGIDGLRHVMRPYINYTYISKPNVNRKYLYYFDDIDRIEKENFFRFGVENRLQTRNGDSGIREYFSMENYWDLYLEKSEDDLSNIGNFCTKISFNPIRSLTLSTEFSIDGGGNNKEMEEYVRKHGRKRNPGLNAKWLNRWNISLTYEPVKDYEFTIKYEYYRPYNARSAYSMGSTLELFEAGSYFNCYRSKRSEMFTFGARMPLTTDRRTFGSMKLEYDVLKGGFSTIGFMVSRQFHCVEVIGSLVFERDDSESSSSGWDTNFAIQARLLGLEMPVNNERNRMLARANDVSFGGDKQSRNFW